VAAVHPSSVDVQLRFVRPASSGSLTAVVEVLAGKRWSKSRVMST
jgi:hypothetical protein